MFANQEGKSHKSQKILARHKPSVNRICSRTHWQHQLELGERGLPGLGYGGSAFLGHLFVNDLVGEAVDGLVRQSGTGRAVTLQRLEAVHLESILILKDFFIIFPCQRNIKYSMLFISIFSRRQNPFVTNVSFRIIAMPLYAGQKNTCINWQVSQIKRYFIFYKRPSLNNITSRTSPYYIEGTYTRFEIDFKKERNNLYIN